MITDQAVESMTREELHQHCLELEKLVKHAARTFVAQKKQTHRRPAWAYVKDGFCVGSTYASRICARYGINPNEGE